MIVGQTQIHRRGGKQQRNEQLGLDLVLLEIHVHVGVEAVRLTGGDLEGELRRRGRITVKSQWILGDGPRVRVSRGVDDTRQRERQGYGGESDGR